MRCVVWVVAGAILGGCSRPSPSAIRFTEKARSAGLDYRWQILGKRPLNLLQSIGNGCAFLDYDNDGNLDILLVGTEPTLFRGDGKGHFVRSGSLPRLQGHFLGCAVGDLNNDGFPDLCLTGFQEGRILLNQQGKSFADVTERWGFAPLPWGTSAAFADIDNDRYLDLYAANYVKFRPGTNLDLCPIHGDNGKTIFGSCPPTLYPPLKGVLYHNERGERFTDVTAPSGAQRRTGNGLGVAFADYDGSGRPGLAVANDMTASDLFRNLGGGRMENVGDRSGVAVNAEGKVYAGMGLDWGDYDNDGRLDLAMTAFENQSKPLYRNEGDGLFTDKGVASGLAAPMRDAMPFGCKWADFDNDGNLDIIFANGHVQDEIAVVNPRQSYRQSIAVFRGDGKGQFADIGHASGVAALPPIVGRGLATGDYDNDGKVDVLIVDSEGEPLLLHNETKNQNHWLTLKLIGAKSARDAYGARVTISAGGRTFVRHCHADGSYLSSSSPCVPFGLGTAAKIDSLVVRWPDGLRETFAPIGIDQRQTIQEGAGGPSPH